MTNFLLTKIFLLTSLSFVISLIFTPLWTNFLYKYKLGKHIRDDGSTPVYTKMHLSKAGTPTMGAVLIWGTAFFIIAGFWILDRIFHLQAFHAFNFLTRKETLLPLGAFLGASIVGLMDDFLDIKKLGAGGKGFRFRFKIWLYTAIALIGSWWFYFKLGFDTIHLPFYGQLSLGWLFIPVFILIVVGTAFAVNLTDGLDGLAGGTLLISFFTLEIICYIQGKENLAAFIGVIVGSLLAFLWFNVYPARFFMGDTGSMGMGVLLAIIAFLTNTVLLLPFIGFVFLLEALSFFVQLFWRKVFKKKLFLSSPIHHHLEAKGWPETKVTMRFWIIATVFSIIGIIFYFIG